MPEFNPMYRSKQRKDDVEWTGLSKQRGTIAVKPRTNEPRPGPTPVRETDRNWRATEYKF